MEFQFNLKIVGIILLSSLEDRISIEAIHHIPSYSISNKHDCRKLSFPNNGVLYTFATPFIYLANYG